MRQSSKRVPDSAEKTVRDIRRATRRHHSAEDKIRPLARRLCITSLFSGLGAAWGVRTIAARFAAAGKHRTTSPATAQPRATGRVIIGNAPSALIVVLVCELYIWLDCTVGR